MKNQPKRRSGVRALFPFFFTLVVLFCLAACQNNSRKEGGKEEVQKEEKHTTHKKTTPPSNDKQETEQEEEQDGFFPDIPNNLTTKEEQAKYVFLHYWDKFPFSNNEVFVGKENPGEQHIANYLSFFAYGAPSQEIAEESLKNFTEKMAAHMQTYGSILEMLHKYLYNPNSPYYNEPLLIRIMQLLVSNPQLDATRKSTLRFKIELMKKNMPGAKAANFSYTTISGKKTSLKDTGIGNVPLLLIFFDPNCTECHRTIELMKDDSRLDNYIHEGKLMVLAIYTENEKSAWDKVPGMLPPLWMVGNDQGEVREKMLYDLKAMPTLYLLNSNKEVVLKDAPYPTVMDYLERYN